MIKILFFFSLLILVSCEKYSQPSLLSLSGEYVVDKITYSNVDNGSSINDTIYLPGQTFINLNDVSVLDTLEVGFTRLHLDYSTISFTPKEKIDGSTEWLDKYLYYVTGQNSDLDLGYFQFEIDGTKRIWKIIDDGAESIVFRTTGQWVNGSSGSNDQITMFLTRTGP